jgi:hypothetical protein
MREIQCASIRLEEPRFDLVQHGISKGLEVLKASVPGLELRYTGLRPIESEADFRLAEARGPSSL